MPSGTSSMMTKAPPSPSGRATTSASGYFSSSSRIASATSGVSAFSTSGVIQPPLGVVVRRHGDKALPGMDRDRFVVADNVGMPLAPFDTENEIWFDRHSLGDGGSLDGSP